jgi:hypothetical protein
MPGRNGKWADAENGPLQPEETQDGQVMPGFSLMARSISRFFDHDA